MTIIDIGRACQRGRKASSWRIARTPWFRAGNGCATTRPPAGAVAGSGAWTSGLRDPSGFNLLGAELNPHKMNGQHVGQLQRVTTRSQRDVAVARRGTRELWTGFRSRFFSDQGCPTIKLIPTPWAS